MTPEQRIRLIELIQSVLAEHADFPGPGVVQNEHTLWAQAIVRAIEERYDIADMQQSLDKISEELQKLSELCNKPDLARATPDQIKRLAGMLHERNLGAGFIGTEPLYAATASALIQQFEDD